MAERRASDINHTDNNLWYCHSCQESTELSTADYTCSKCQSGFVEQVEQQTSQQEENVGPVPSSMHRLFHRSRSSPYSTSGSQGRVLRSATIEIHRLQPSSSRESSFQEFMSQLIGRVNGGSNGVGSGSDSESGAVNVVFGPTTLMMGQLGGNLIVTSGGLNRLDNIITMLLNQLDQAGTGPPPASENQISALPTVGIKQEQVDACLQCNICMEDFQLDERVRSLPCKHIYHGVCIVPWLELHGTCPICRRDLDFDSTAAVPGVD